MSEFLHQNEIASILAAAMPRNTWVPLTDIYELVESRARLTPIDNEPEAPGATAPRWRRNVRNYLQAHKDGDPFDWDGEARYRYREPSPTTAPMTTTPPHIPSPAPANAADWELEPGEQIRRTHLHDLYGGSRQGGTIPSRTTPNIFLFLDRARAAEHGYYDGWVGDLLYYTGHGQRGDQEFKAGNAAVLRQQQDGRAVRVFRGAAGTVTYLGAFRLDDEQPYFQMDATEPDTGIPRQVIVFRLHPIGDVLHEAEDELDPPDGLAAATLDRTVTSTVTPLLTRVPIEQQHTEDVEVSRTAESYTAKRREQTLVLDYTRYLEERGLTVSRFRVQPAGEARPIVCDLHDETRNNLIEAKGAGTRGEIRMAIGQLHDYRRFLDPKPALAVLLPHQPRHDLEQLVAEAGIAAVWATEGAFRDNADGRFT